MCGIAGYFTLNQNHSEKVIRDMCNEIVHRGPDQDGYHVVDIKGSQLALGHRRLSIIDLSEKGRQPMSYKQWTIIFNGEIYNYTEIREELKLHGYEFDSHSDTAVILRAFDKWGIDCLDKFIGMFAFSIFNELTNKLVIVRDRAGVKPLYYNKSETNFLWGSQLRSFHKYPVFEPKIDQSSLQLFFSYGYIPAPFTIFEKVYKLEPGHFLEFDLTLNVLKIDSFWKVEDAFNQKISLDENEVVTNLEKLLISAFDYRMVSDVPVGVFLSGGYDSATVAALLQKNRSEKIKTFTIGFEDENYNEAPAAKEIAEYLGTEHHEVICTEKEAKEIIPKLAEIYDEPFGDSSAIPTYLVSKMASKHVKVVLSADGGDEQFFGYNRYPAILSNFSLFTIIPGFFTRIGASLAKTFFTNDYRKSKALKTIIGVSKSKKNLKFQFLNAMSVNRSFSAKKFDLVNVSNGIYKTNFLKEIKINHLHPIDQLTILDYKTYMVDDILTKVDRSTMAVSIEGREPLLDHRIIEFLAKIPAELKFKNGVKKYLLKEVAYKYIPKELLDRPKKGFAIPIQKWFRTDLKYLLDIYLSDKNLSHGLINQKVVYNLLKQYYAGDDSVFELIWFVLNFQMWYERWMKNEIKG
jgi:asparagine synthase (glutamine-hydrolysing)